MKAKSQRSASARKPAAAKDSNEKSRQPQRGEGTPGAQVQGEGNYDAARRFNEAERKYVKTADVDEAARAAQPHDPEEARDLERAESETREHAKDEDPQLRHPKSRGTRKGRESGQAPGSDRQDETAAPASPDGDDTERYAG